MNTKHHYFINWIINQNKIENQFNLNFTQPQHHPIDE